jgi:gluconate 2-dehydrogenase gamma chain
MVDGAIFRRQFLVGAGALATAMSPATPSQAQAAPAASPASPAVPADEPLLTLMPTEHAFIVAAVDTLIPADELSPSGSFAASTYLSTASSPALGAAAPRCIAAARSTKASPSRAISCR